MKTDLKKWLPTAIAIVMIFPFLLTGCASTWALNPRDRSIKKWETKEKRKRELIKEAMATDTTYFYFYDARMNKR